MTDLELVEDTKIALAKQGAFWTIQGEGHLRGFQMAFLRLAGCSVGCPQCDTDYSVHAKYTVQEVVCQVSRVMPNDDRDQWVWITGGDPGDLPRQRLQALLSGLKAFGYSTAVATSGAKRVVPPVDWLSVSPHSVDASKFQQRYGDEVKLVDGLNGLDLWEWQREWGDSVDFMYRYVQPLSKPGFDGAMCEDPESLGRCLRFLRDNPRWALSRQDHLHWRVK